MTNTIALHSSLSHGGQWKPLKKALQPHTTELATPDLIGYGRGQNLTTWLEQQANQQASLDGFGLAAELKQLIADQQVQLNQRYQAIGHSYGGAVALHWAYHHPETVKSLCLYEPTSFHVLPEGSEAREEIEAVAHSMSQQSTAEACELFVDYWNQPGYFVSLPQPIQESMLAQHAKVLLDFQALLHEPLTAQDYQRLTVPVTLFVGRQSPLSSRAVSQQLAAYLPNVQLHEVDAGHMGPISHARTLAPLMAAVIK